MKRSTTSGTGSSTAVNRAAGRRGRYALILAYHFPPMVGAPSQRAASFVRHLPRMGWTPIVITCRTGLFHRDARQAVQGVRVIHSRNPEPGRMINAARRRHKDGVAVSTEEVTPIEGGRLVSAARRLVREWLYVPDGQVGWVPFAVGAVRKALERVSGPTVLLSSSVPISAHLAASAIARRSGIPWVAEFRDPWSTVSPLVRPRSRARARVDRAIESKIVSGADAVVVTADRTSAMLRAAHPTLGASDVRVIRNGFEPSGLQGSPPGRGEPCSFVFLGVVPEHVSLEPLLVALRRVAERRPRQFTLRVIGPSGPWRAADGSEWLRLEGTAPSPEARAAIATASVNVLYRPGDEAAGIVAAKLYEYLGARRPILGILPPNSEMEWLGKRFGDLRAVHDHRVSALEAAITTLVDEHQAGALQAEVEPAEPVEELTWETQVRRLASLLDDLTQSESAR